MWVLSLDQEDPLEEEMATQSSILAWRIPWTEEPGGLQSKELDMTEQQDNNNTPLYGYITFVVQHESPAHFFLWRNGASQSISFYGSVVKKQKQKQKTHLPMQET